MKNANLRNILILVGAVLLVIYFRWQEDTEHKASTSSNNLILAISWQPAFCEGRPNVPECRSQRENRFDAKNFSLHGLWPQPRDNIYCNVSEDIIHTDKSGRWGDLPKLALSEDLRKKLTLQMPGYRSHLHRHEWYKHGVCIAGGTPESYFAISLQLLSSINASPLSSLFADNIGREVSAAQITQAFEAQFGKGLGDKVSISCRRDSGRTLINELRISLATNGEEKNSLSDIFKAAPPIPIGCKRGIVDPVGLQ